MRARCSPHYTDTFEATPDLLASGACGSRDAMGDRVAAEHYARSLRMDYPTSDQTRALARSYPQPRLLAHYDT